MTVAEPGQVIALLWALGALALVGIVVYGRLFWRLVRTGGQVRVEMLGLPELIFGALLFSWLGLLAVRGFSAPPQPVGEASLISGASVFALIVLAVIVLLKYRHFRLHEVFGLSRVGAGTLIPRALGWLVLVFPLVAGTNLLVQHFFPQEAHAQEIVQYFLTSYQRGDGRAVAETIVLGVVVAPFCEELIFRGFLYGTAKRYLGVVPALLLVALLFAAVHLNLSALPGLMLLAVCFTIAYETTGSLFTSMLMHACFNGTSLVLLMLAPRLATT